ncbi:MAG TPA: hypothetical protein VLG27_04565 [Candidatus Saccharimonadia bacterium]|nr:hypothetical protein [Candidatus Saccharimonadia bacterium]
MKAKLAGLLVPFLAVWLVGGVAAAQGQYPTAATGVDVSWPNCSTSIPKAAVFGIVGVNNGKGFSANPCLKKEASHFLNLSLYANTGYPDSSFGLQYQNSPQTCASNDLPCLAYNYGYNAGLYAYNTAASNGLGSVKTWWLDVETMNTWTPDALQNQSSLKGESDALLAKGAATIGVYSTTAQWQTITGGWQNGWPSWGATTWTTAKQAAGYCNGHQFTGGPSYLMQFLPKHSLDQDYAC